MQLPDFADGGIAVERRLGARDRDVDVGQCGLDAGGPRIGLRDGGRAGAAICAGGAPPALARELAQRARAVAVDDDADVVERRVRIAAVIDAARVVFLVRGTCPSARA